MKTPSNRILKRNSAGQQLLDRIVGISEPVVAIDTTDALSAALLSNYPSFFEANWISSLGLSSRLGFSDAYNLSPRDYIELVNDVKMVSTKTFIIVDADNGGQSFKNTSYAFKLYSSLGVASAFVENKKGVKFNSVDQYARELHTLEDKDVFVQKIKSAINSQNTTLVGIRLEDGIANDNDEEKAIKFTMNSVAYFIEHSKPDFFLFHWKKESPEIPLKFAKEYHDYIKKFDIQNSPYLACIPTTYSKNITNRKLYECGYHMIIYGNALLRIQTQAICEALESIKGNDSLKKLEEKMSPTKLILDLIEGRKKR